MDARHFYSQRNAFDDPFLRRVTCGPTALAMVFAAEGKLDRFIVREGSLETFLAWIVDQFRSSRPTLRREFVLDGNRVWVPMDYLANSPIQLEGDIVTQESEFLPIFTTEVGYDHRGSKRLCAEVGIRAELKERVFPLSEMVAKFHSGAFKYFLASTTYQRPEAPPSTHIVVVHAFSRDSQTVFFADSAKPNAETGLRTMSRANFEKIYRGYGTAVLE